MENVEHFPKSDVIGAVDPAYIIAYLVGTDLSDEYRRFFPKVWLGRYFILLGRLEFKITVTLLSERYDILTDNVETVIKSRKKTAVGSPLHGIGLSVKIVNGCGYRPLTEAPGFSF